MLTNCEWVIQSLGNGNSKTLLTSCKSWDYVINLSIHFNTEIILKIFLESTIKFNYSSHDHVELDQHLGDNSKVKNFSLAKWLTHEDPHLLFPKELCKKAGDGETHFVFVLVSLNNKTPTERRRQPVIRTTEGVQSASRWTKKTSVGSKRN